MSFSFLVWNVRQYGGNSNRLQKVVDTIAGFDPEPDVFGLLEFQAKDEVRSLMLDAFPDFDFGMTDSRQGLELLVGWRRGFFDQAIYSQRRKFQRSEYLRPGGLVSLAQGGNWYNLLFLHTDSGASEADFKNRRETFGKIWSLEKRLRAIPEMSGKANLIAMGDLNTMGDGDAMTGPEEIAWLAGQAKSNRMRLVTKEFDETWHQWARGGWSDRKKLRIQDLPGAMRSNLDHVIASDGLKLQNLTTAPDGSQAQVFVEGWQQLQGNDRIDFLWNVSDHSALYGRVEAQAARRT